MKTVFVTGGAGGMGKAAVCKFCEQGVQVGFIDCDEAAGHSLQQSLGDQSCLFFPGDVRSSKDIEHAAAETALRFGGVDCLFVHAGIHRHNSVLDIADEELDLMLDINFKGVVYALRAVIPHIIEAGGGSIVLMASDQALVGKKNSFIYGASKAAVAQMAKSLALDLAKHRIRVNAVCPGTIRTAMSEQAVGRHAKRELAGDIERAWALQEEKHPIGRVGTPEEAAELIYFLASEAASFITGGLYVIDGGLTAA